jgi:hypothetical protein
MYLISCVSKKRTKPAQALDLYVSEWFRRARAYVEITGYPWFILSAKYGFVHPDEVIEPYEKKLSTMSVAERKHWAEKLQAQMDKHLPAADRIVVIAGQRYRELLMSYLRLRAREVEVPLEGLRIGEQLSWTCSARMNRRNDLVSFYDILAALENRLGGKRRLAESDGRMSWPERGVYFFFEPDERRSDTGEGPRVVRVGTHALSAKSKTSFWSGLSQHRGVSASGAGNHRGSIFRLLVGAAIKNRDHRLEPVSWGVGSDPGKAALKLGLSREEILRRELALEIEVSRYIRSLPFLWLNVNDAAGPQSNRGSIERSSIALVSNYHREPFDPPSNGWLGSHSDRERVRSSGLWNNNFVDERYDPTFLSLLEKLATE